MSPFKFRRMVHGLGKKKPPAGGAAAATDWRDSPLKAPKYTISTKQTPLYESWWFRSILVAVMVATVASVVVNQQYASNSVGIVSPKSTEKAVKSSESLLSEDESSVAASAEENTSDLSHTANAGIGSSARVTSNEEGLTTIKIDEDFDQWTEEKQQDFLKHLSSILGKKVEVVGPVRRGSVILDVKVDPDTAKRLSDEGATLLQDLLHAKIVNNDGAADQQPASSEGRASEQQTYVDDGEGEIVLHSGDHVDVETGLYTLSSIGGRVFHDLDADGYFEPQTGEVGVPGVIVSLHNADTHEILSVVASNSNGEFSFIQAEPGDYYLHFEPQSRFKISPLTEISGRSSSDRGGSVIVNDVFPTSGNTSVLTLSSGRKSLEVNAGIFAMATIKGVWFVDKNGNGRMDAEERFLVGAGLERGSIELLADNRQFVAASIDVASISPQDGSYKFTDLRPGQYSIRVSAPLPDYSVAPKWLGYRQVGAVYNDIDPTDGEVDQIFLRSEESLQLNVGVLQPVSISGVVWEDMDGVGSSPFPRRFIPGAKVTIMQEDGKALHTVTSAKTGAFSFTHLAPGAYIVQVEPPSPRYKFSPRMGASDRARILGNSPSGAVFSDIDPSTGRSVSYLLESGTAKTDANVGLYTLASITGLVWDDLDAGGTFNPDQGEKGLPGIPVRLEKKDGSLVAEVVTNPEGRYTFLNLEPGRYKPPRIYAPQDYHKSVNAKITFAFVDSDTDAMLNEDI